MADKANNNWHACAPAGSWQAANQADGSWQRTGARASWPDSGQEAGDWGYSCGWGKPAAVVPNRLAVLGALLVGVFMILLEATIVNVAVPAIQRGMHASDGAQVAALCALTAMVITAVLVPLLPRGAHSEEWSG